MGTVTAINYLKCMTLFIIIIALYSVIIHSVMLLQKLQYNLKINMQKYKLVHFF